MGAESCWTNALLVAMILVLLVLAESCRVLSNPDIAAKGVIFPVLMRYSLSVSPPIWSALEDDEGTMIKGPLISVRLMKVYMK